jgi:hypothetical protein
VVAIVVRNDAKNGGAVRPCALTAVKPISFNIVGRKTGRDEKLTLQLKYINFWNENLSQYSQNNLVL